MLKRWRAAPVPLAPLAPAGPPPPALRDDPLIWGEARIDEGAPAVERHCDVAFLPLDPAVWFEDDPRWGVYGADGALIDAAAHRVGPDAQLKGQSPTLAFDFEALPERVGDEALIYGGPINPHYGHFLCSTLSRLWIVARDGLQGRRVVFHCAEKPADLLQDRPFVADIFGALGLTPDDMVFLKRPTRLDRLVAPRPSFREQAFASRAYLHIADRVGRALAGHLPEDRAAPVYLSKTRLPNGVGRMIDEPLIEEVLRGGGVEIVHPERLPLSEQIGLFRRRRVVAGNAGSQFHTAVFAPGRSRNVCLCARSAVNSNAVMFDRLRDQATLYLHAGEPHKEIFRQDGFLAQTRFAEPRRVAEALLEAIWREDALLD